VTGAQSPLWSKLRHYSMVRAAPVPAGAIVQMLLLGGLD
jgi:hypothetical protein